MKVLIVYATRNGSTQEVATFIGDALREAGLDVTIADADTVQDVTPYDAFVLGTGIYRGEWLPALRVFLRKFRADIGDKPIFAWMLCIRLLETDGQDYVMAEYVPHHLLDGFNVQDIQPFLGKLLLAEVDLSDRWALSLRYEGNIDPTQVNADYRDWDAIRDWALRIAQQVKSVPR